MIEHIICNPHLNLIIILTSSLCILHLQVFRQETHLVYNNKQAFFFFFKALFCFCTSWVFPCSEMRSVFTSFSILSRTYSLPCPGFLKTTQGHRVGGWTFPKPYYFSKAESIFCGSIYFMGPTERFLVYSKWLLFWTSFLTMLLQRPP